MDEQFKTLNDKDKVILIANVYVKNVTRERAILMMNQMLNHFKDIFDDTVKVLVMPVLDESLQKIEIFNADKCNEEILQKLNENYAKVIESFSK